ncbi:MAG: family 20 glycosylhydrolase [Lewinellaceae bacterium]|nr:family 20 glycosylhydrolase [Lewinellaceae bacterium]
MNKHLLLLLLASYSVLTTFAQGPAAAADILIPKPTKIEAGEGYFTWTPGTEISIPKNARDLVAHSQLLKAFWGTNTPPAATSNRINLKLDSKFPSSEGYRLSISASGIDLTAATPAGLFYGIQSLLQLATAGRESNTLTKIAAAVIQDQPRFGYRGMHLDVSRHFFPVAFIKEYLDMLATYKFNYFHWHLTDDQGWRIEIKRYPKLQQVAAWREETLQGHARNQPARYDGRAYGGFYTQSEVREIVKYAQERYITIIPEIEMPGHSVAVLAAYPELACTDGPFKVATKWGVFEDVFCPKEETFTFLENVLSEVIALFPGKYIHIGGDECPKTRWKESSLAQAVMKTNNLADEDELQSYFIRRIEAFLQSKGKRLMGWDEILEGGLAPNATVMSWRGIQGGIDAARQGHDVVMTPTQYCYFDYYQADNALEPLAIGGMLPIEKVYSYEPIPAELTPQESRHILGAQGNVWTEYIADPADVQYMAYARMMALSEVVWSDPTQKEFRGFAQRLAPQLNHWQQQGINVANRLFDLSCSSRGLPSGGIEVTLKNPIGNGEIRYELDGRDPKPNSPLYQEAMLLEESALLRATTFVDGKQVAPVAWMDIYHHLGIGAKLSLSQAPANRYLSLAPNALLNGVRGRNNRFDDQEWIGFDQGHNLVALIDMGTSKPLQYLQLRFFHQPGAWIYAPKQIEVYWAEDEAGQQISGPVRMDINSPLDQVATVRVPLPKTTRFLRILVPNAGQIPAGQPGAGNGAWLFVDEIEIH